MKKKYVLIVLVIVLSIIIVYIALTKKKDNEIVTNDINVVPTFVDEISNDASWCATFNLIWNDLKNDIVKQDIKFKENSLYANNLNKELFKESDISDEYYYKVYGKKTLQLKSEIEKAIKEKFDQKSDILDKFDWSTDALDKGTSDFERYLFYTMLYREFKYKTKFVELEEDQFNNIENVKYFGIKDNKAAYKNQISVLYYNNVDDFAIKLYTTGNDEIIINKGPKGTTFKEIYDSIISQSLEFKGNKTFGSIDNFKMPYIKFNSLREYKELENKEFYDIYHNDMIIDKALQTIKFELNESGGKIKSEAGMDVIKYTSLENVDEPRNFIIDKTFAIFLKEESKDKPYFAAKINDITKYQKKSH